MNGFRGTTSAGFNSHEDQMFQNATIEYGETRKIAEYENKTCKIILGLSLDGLDDVDALLDAALSNIQFQVRSRLGVKTEKPVGIEPPKKSTKAPKVEDEPGTTEPPKKAKKAKAPKVEDDAELFDDAADVAEEIEAETGEEVDEFAEAEEKEITDEDLLTAVMEKNKELNDPDRIKKLIWKAAGKDGASVKQIEQGKRQKFLDKLGELKKGGE